MHEPEIEPLYQVVVNEEEQYSIWSSQSQAPAGWRSVGFAGTKAECLAHVDEIWRDMRPLSLRKHMARTAS